MLLSLVPVLDLSRRRGERIKFGAALGGLIGACREVAEVQKRRDDL